MEDIIIKLLFDDDEFFKKVSPFLSIEFFDGSNNKIIIRKIIEFVNKYHSKPSYEEIQLDISSDKEIEEGQADEVGQSLDKVKNEEKSKYTLEHMIDQTEGYFQEAALSKAILHGAEILNGNEKHRKHELPEMVRNALRICFNNEVGMQYGTDKTIEDQYSYYHHRDRKFPFPNLISFNRITKGGFSKKKMAIIVGGTNVGKCVCHEINIKVRNKKTGEIKTLPIGELYDKICSKM
jgi:hypothetical protein